MKLNPKLQLGLAIGIVSLVTLMLILGRVTDIEFGGLVLNKWTVLAFYGLAVAELVYIKVKGSKCTSHCETENEHQERSS